MIFDPDAPDRSHRGDWTKSLAVGADGVKDLMPLVRRFAYQGQFVITDKGLLSMVLQKQAGDILFNHYNKGGDLVVVGIEVKTDVTDYYNFFLEVWSNRSRETVGWMHTMKCDYLWYYFKNRGTMYSIDLPRLQKWAFEEGNIRKYELKAAIVPKQLNDPWGHCVPITVIKEEVGFKTFLRRHTGEWELEPQKLPVAPQKKHWEEELPPRGHQPSLFKV